MATVNYICKALDQLGKSYSYFSDSERGIEYVSESGKQYFFIGSGSTLVHNGINIIARDKGFTYTLLHDMVAMPKTQWYYDPQGSSEKKTSYEEIFSDIATKFSFPLMIKMNKGSQGRHIYKCTTIQEVEQSIRAIFTRDKDYDFMALAQEYIEIHKEYRVLVYDNEVQFVYLKDNSKADFVGNISPLHFDWAQAILIQDDVLLDEMKAFVARITSRLQLHYNGLDITIDKKGKRYLIELNGNPWFSIFTRDNGDEEVVKMYKKIILDLP